MESDANLCRLPPGLASSVVQTARTHGDRFISLEVSLAIACSFAICHALGRANLTLRGPSARIVEGAVTPILMQARPLACGY